MSGTGRVAHSAECNIDFKGTDLSCEHDAASGWRDGDMAQAAFLHTTGLLFTHCRAAIVTQPLVAAGKNRDQLIQVETKFCMLLRCAYCSAAIAGSKYKVLLIEMGPLPSLLQIKRSVCTTACGCLLQCCCKLQCRISSIASLGSCEGMHPRKMTASIPSQERHHQASAQVPSRGICSDVTLTYQASHKPYSECMRK